MVGGTWSFSDDKHEVVPSTRCYGRINYSRSELDWRHDGMSGQHVSNDATLGDGTPAIAFEVVVSVQFPALVCVVFFQRPAEL